MDLAGIGKERLHLAWVSSAEAQRFVEVVSQTTASVKAQGKFDPSVFTMQLDAAEKTLRGETLRWLVGKEVKTTTTGDVYGRKWDVERFETVLDSVLEREYHKNLILIAIKDGASNVRAISTTIGVKIGLPLQTISYLLADLEKTGVAEFRGMHDGIPEFVAL